MQLKLRFPILFLAAFTACSLLFSLMSWGQLDPGPVRIPQISADLILHEIGHAGMGALAALPTLRAVPILVVAIGAVLFDADHIGYYIGLPMDGRASHSALFILVAFVIIYFFARKGFLGRNLPPILTGFLALSSVLAHLAFDAISADGFPIWSPFSYRIVLMTPAGGIFIEIVAIILIWVSWNRRRGQEQNKTLR